MSDSIRTSFKYCGVNSNHFVSVISSESEEECDDDSSHTGQGKRTRKRKASPMEKRSIKKHLSLTHSHHHRPPIEVTEPGESESDQQDVFGGGGCAACISQARSAFEVMETSLQATSQMLRHIRAAFEVVFTGKDELTKWQHAVRSVSRTIDAQVLAYRRIMNEVDCQSGLEQAQIRELEKELAKVSREADYFCRKVEPSSIISQFEDRLWTVEKLLREKFNTLALEHNRSVDNMIHIEDHMESEINRILGDLTKSMEKLSKAADIESEQLKVLSDRVRAQDEQLQKNTEDIAQRRQRHADCQCRKVEKDVRASIRDIESHIFKCVDKMILQEADSRDELGRRLEDSIRKEGDAVYRDAIHAASNRIANLREECIRGLTSERNVNNGVSRKISTLENEKRGLQREISGVKSMYRARSTKDAAHDAEIRALKERIKLLEEKVAASAAEAASIKDAEKVV